MNGPTTAANLAPIWLVKMPIHKYYKETADEVKALARKHGCRVVNAKFAEHIGPQFLTDNPPQLTDKPKRGRKKKAEPQPEPVQEVAPESLVEQG